MHQSTPLTARRTFCVCLAVLLSMGFVASQSWAANDDEAALVARDTVFDFLGQQHATLCLSAADVAGATVDHQSLSRHTGTQHLYLEQRHEGIAVYNGILSVAVAENGTVAHVGNRFVSNLSQSIVEGDRVMVRDAIRAGFI